MRPRTLQEFKEQLTARAQVLRRHGLLTPEGVMAWRAPRRYRASRLSTQSRALTPPEDDIVNA